MSCEAQWTRLRGQAIGIAHTLVTHREGIFVPNKAAKMPS